jgi:hypothetical protein
MALFAEETLIDIEEDDIVLTQEQVSILKALTVEARPNRTK